MCSDGFDLHTDHTNLIFTFEPLYFLPDIIQPGPRKVLRWAVHLSAYTYVFFHISGEDNVWADFHTLWAIKLTICRLFTIHTLTTTVEAFDWPTMESNEACQLLHLEFRPECLWLTRDVFRGPDGAIWIPNPDEGLQISLEIISHTGAAGHRGRRETESALRKAFFDNARRRHTPLHPFLYQFPLNDRGRRFHSRSARLSMGRC